ncbi:ribonuclease P protein component [Desmospora sp. 8437]|nr:ribonuclease P protein component [Desmospora sp. 8437]
MSGINRVRKVLRHTGLHHELTHRPPGKRSVAVAKRGRAVQRCYGNRRSTCLWKGKEIYKKTR